VTAGVASLAARDLLRGIRRHGKVLAALPHAIYLEFADAVPEPRVIAVSPPDAIRLPNAIITGPWETPPSTPPAAPGRRSRLGAVGRLPRGAAFVRKLTV
jgi:hypothetical protein